jgi:hypothetical protein
VARVAAGGWGWFVESAPKPLPPHSVSPFAAQAEEVVEPHAEAEVVEAELLGAEEGAADQAEAGEQMVRGELSIAIR